MNDERPAADHATPPPLPTGAPVKKSRTLWWVLGGVAVVLLTSYALALWFVVTTIRSSGALSGPTGVHREPPAAPSGPVNRRSADKTADGDAAVYEQQVDSYLADFAAPYLEAGYSADFTSDASALAGGDSDRVEIELAADREHVVFAVCDDDCTDLDLTLFDENDNVVDSDYLVDSEPVVEVVPAWTGSFAVGVDMVDCLAADCLWAFAVYSRPAPAGGGGAPRGVNPKSH